MVRMPSKHEIKTYRARAYYHVYNEGVEKNDIFKDVHDYNAFLSMLNRYLSNNQDKDKYGRPYPSFAGSIKLNAYCLMSNHLHLLVYQEDERSLANFMRSLMTSYSMYFNEKHGHKRAIFQGRYRAAIVQDENLLPHISRYIHLNPVDYKEYPFTSYKYYIQKDKPIWLYPSAVLKHLPNTMRYTTFVADISDYKHSLEVIRPMLANY